MTKAKLERLIALSNRTALFRADEEVEELQALQSEFEAWEPEQAIPRCSNCDYLSWACRRCGHVEMASYTGWRENVRR